MNFHRNKSEVLKRLVLELCCTTKQSKGLQSHFQKMPTHTCRNNILKDVNLPIVD